MSASRTLLRKNKMFEPKPHSDKNKPKKVGRHLGQPEPDGVGWNGFGPCGVIKYLHPTKGWRHRHVSVRA